MIIKHNYSLPADDFTRLTSLLFLLALQGSSSSSSAPSSSTALGNKKDSRQPVRDSKKKKNYLLNYTWQTRCAGLKVLCQVVVVRLTWQNAWYKTARWTSTRPGRGGGKCNDEFFSNGTCTKSDSQPFIFSLSYFVRLISFLRSHDKECGESFSKISYLLWNKKKKQPSPFYYTKHCWNNIFLLV